MGDWAELPHDVVELIVKKINLLEDFVRFGAVCKSLRDIATSNSKMLPPQIPWLILPDKPPGDDHRQIYSLSKEDILIKNLYIPEMSDKKCIGLDYGWILTITRKRGEINLVHPISRAQIELPPQTSIEGYEDIMPTPSYMFIHSAALSGNPSEPSDFILMIVDCFGMVSYWRSGSKHWIGIQYAECMNHVTYYQDQFYSASYNSDVWGYKVNHDHSIIAYQINTTECPVEKQNWPYIVGSTCGLLLVARENHHEEDLDEAVVYPIQHNSEGEEDDYEETPEQELKEDSHNRCWLDTFHVFEFDLITREYKQVKSLGDRAIFVGHNTSISIDCASEFPGIKSDYIYFTDDYTEHYVSLLKGGGEDMGAYNMKDGQTTPFKIEESSTRSRISPPFWFIPSL